MKAASLDALEICSSQLQERKIGLRLTTKYQMRSTTKSGSEWAWTPFSMCGM